MYLIKIQLIVLIQFNLAYLAKSSFQLTECIDQDWFKLDNRICIHRSKLRLSYEQSKDYCRIKYNANRLTISNKEKQKSITNYLYHLNHQEDRNDFKVWLGLNRIKRNSQSYLLWDNEIEMFNRLNHALNDSITVDKDKNSFNSNYTKIGLIKLNSNQTNLLSLDKLISNRLILKFDNRFRINQVDSQFYLSNQTDLWRMSFQSANRFNTICELPINKGT